MTIFVFPVYEVVIRDMEDLGERLEFQVSDVPLVCFNPGDHIFIHVIACKLEQVGYIPLGIMVLFPKFH